MITAISTCPKARGTVGFATPRLLTPAYNYTLQRTIPSVRRPVTLSSPHRSGRGYWNINQLSIGFPLRVHLRPRLTLIRLALIRKPWSIGVRVSHPHYRYLCLHLLFWTLHQALRPGFDAARMLPYHSTSKGKIYGFGSILMPDYHPRTVARLVSCYALFK